MTTSKVTRNFQITIPAEVRRLLHLQIGSLVGFVVEKGAVILKPKKLIDGEQAWFWTKEWQKGEKEAEEDIKKGRVRSFKNVEEIKRHFEK